MSSNAVPPSVTPPSPHEWLSTVQTITNVTNDALARITCPNHGFTSADVGVTSIMVLQVVGMLPINGLPGVIQQIIDTNNFTVNINSTQFPIYRGAGVVSTLTGEPPIERQGFQYFNTPFQNIAP